MTGYGLEISAHEDQQQCHTGHTPGQDMSAPFLEHCQFSWLPLDLSAGVPVSHLVSKLSHFFVLLTAERTTRTLQVFFCVLIVALRGTKHSCFLALCWPAEVLEDRQKAHIYVKILAKALQHGSAVRRDPSLCIGLQDVLGLRPQDNGDQVGAPKTWGEKP